MPASRFLSKGIIGAGSCGTVYSVVDAHHGLRRAMKVLPKVRHDMQPNDTLAMARGEIDALRSLQGCPNIVELYEVIDDDDAWCIVQELGEPAVCAAPACMLPDHAARMLRDVARALDWCHAKKYVYGDLKPDNVVYCPASAAYKLVDFGSCVTCFDDDAPVRLRRATPAYLAPETAAAYGLATVKSDVWAYGVLVRHVAGSTPSKPDFQLLADMCMRKEPESRISAGDAMRIVDDLIKVNGLANGPAN